MPHIHALADELAPRGAFCDLFAGSGTVSASFAGRRGVVSVDIQTYAAVLCRAVLQPLAHPETLGTRLISEALSAPFSTRLRWALEPVIALEEAQLAAAGETGEDLYDLVEQASFATMADDPSHVRHPGLRAAMETAQRRLVEADLHSGPATVVSRHFGGAYFSFRQAAFLDGLLAAVHALPPPARDYFLAVALSTCSELVNTVGKHFAQPLRPRNRDGTVKRSLLGKIQRDRRVDPSQVFESWLGRYAALPRNGCAAHTFTGDVDAFLSSWDRPLGLVYADPPYTRDHYSRYYHVLETICRRDEPEISRNKAHGREPLSRGVYRMDRHQSPFSIRSQAPAAFARLFAGVRRHEVPLLLSYSPDQSATGARPRMMATEHILELARTTFSDVELRTVEDATHVKLNRVERNAAAVSGAEIFILCRP